jgi:hypothetical protein
MVIVDFIKTIRNIRTVVHAGKIHNWWLVVKFFISIFRTIVYNFYNTFKYIRISGIYYGFLIFFLMNYCKAAPLSFSR